MEVRKLIKSGPSTLVVSLPVNWIKQNKLKQGDSVFLEGISRGIMINPSSRKAKQTKTRIIDTDKSFLITQQLKSKLLRNHSPIVIKIHNNLEEIARIMKEFQNTSYEVHGDTVVVIDHFDHESVNLQKDLASLINLNNSLFHEIVEGKKDFSDIILMVKSLKKKSFLLEKTLNKIIDFPLTRANLTVSEIVRFKITLQELPQILEAELEMCKQLQFLDDVSDVRIGLEYIEPYLLLKEYSVKDVTEMKYRINKIKTKLINLKDHIKIKVFFEILTVFQSVLKVSYLDV